MTRRALHLGDGQDERILTAWDLIENDEPDISTERLIQMVCDTVGCEWSDVIDVLAREAGHGEWVDGAPP